MKETTNTPLAEVEKSKQCIDIADSKTFTKSNQCDAESQDSGLKSGEAINFENSSELNPQNKINQ